MTSLEVLPPEILDHIVHYLPRAHDLANVCLTSKRLNRIITKEGWRAFVLANFPSIQTPSTSWQDAAHALTTLSRNLDRRAFICNELEPSGPIRNVQDGRMLESWRRPTGQTMGFQAILDTYEEVIGSHWSSRNSIVAWSAGAELLIKTKSQNNKESANRSSSDWHVYRDKKYIEGQDDITTVNIVRPAHPLASSSRSSNCQIVIGRASGELTSVALNAKAGQCVVNKFNTAGRTVRSADIAPGTTALLSTCLDDKTLALYSLSSERDIVEPSSQTTCITDNARACRTWSTNFLSTRRVAVGLGPSTHTVHVYQIKEDGLSREPLRKFGHGNLRPTSTYPVKALPSSSAVGSEVDDNVLISGNYDGVLRLHDMRSSEDVVARIEDPVDNSSIFSLETIGRERIIAGGQSHSLLKIFDLRMTGGRVYGYANIISGSPRNLPSSTFRPRVEGTEIYESGWNVFVGQNRQIRTSARRQPKESPIYSLSRPSSVSPILYAGLEDTVVRFNFTSVMDAHPDPIFKQAIRRTADHHFSATDTWFSKPKGPYSLTLYEQMGPLNMQMLYQRNLGQLQRGTCLDHFVDSERGYDERLSRITTSTRLSSARSNFRRW